MKLRWLGHSGFRLEIDDQVLLIDPWIGNPLFDASRRAEAIDGVTHILITHGHFDHIADTIAIAQERQVPVVGIYDLVTWWQEKQGSRSWASTRAARSGSAAWR